MTDGKRLMWVAGHLDGKVCLENCEYPSLPLQQLAVRELLNGKWRRVVPLRTG